MIERGRRIPDVARDLGIGSPETLRNWVKRARVDRGLEDGPTTEELAEIKKLREEVADQQRTIEILKAATTYVREGGRPPVEVRVRFVDEHRDTWPVSAICASIELNERTHYVAKARPASARSVSDEAPKVKIRAVWVVTRTPMGEPRRRSPDQRVASTGTTLPLGPTPFPPSRRDGAMIGRRADLAAPSKEPPWASGSPSSPP